ncbi:tRNA (guanosine(37)-N1)-methyltransferase TrmD [Jannaschia formosa]|uniref:tRNA (guanosine(37)-N1)-methyltransferase TrmD n=1 Tax=Jannaschia formosa TaxID=2259592 RepID=UPI000E1BF02B|nr:tRNA (guanosine(37)-N1)-methyltransferase TrmD [Jannaschia formosa]TFL18698.1 tRNA (guanosine(37)-N1)-methyltransferase TrmD [Jannaschia formosa]
MEPPSRSHATKSIRPTAQPRDLLAETARAGTWTASVVTLFPDAFPGTLGLSLTGTALKAGLWDLRTTDLRGFGLTKHRNVDAPPAGGGPGLVLRADVVGPALDEARLPGPMVYLSPRGRPFTQATARRWAAAPGVTLLCGRFEGVDQRVIDHYGLEEVSLGDFVLTGGEIAAQAMLDATVRLLPGVLGNAASTEDESHSDGLLEHPHYTKPADWRGHGIPEVLTSGDHAKVAAWRRAQAEALTAERRPDLWAKRRGSDV